MRDGPCLPGRLTQLGTGNTLNVGRCFRSLAAKKKKKKINDNRMLHRKRLHIQLTLRHARLNRFLYYRASHVLARMANVQVGL